MTRRAELFATLLVALILALAWLTRGSGRLPRRPEVERTDPQPEPVRPPRLRAPPWL